MQSKEEADGQGYSGQKFPKSVQFGHTTGPRIQCHEVVSLGVVKRRAASKDQSVRPRRSSQREHLGQVLRDSSVTDLLTDAFQEPLCCLCIRTFVFVAPAT